MNENLCSNSGFYVPLELNHHLAPHVRHLALLRLIVECAVPECRPRTPIAAGNLPRISVPTHCGGKVAVRQVIILSADWVRTRSNSSGASGKPTMSVSPTSAGTSVLSVQKLAIPADVVSARRTASGCWAGQLERLATLAEEAEKQ